MHRFDTLLIANRGEIACRVIRTARAMGLRTVAVHSQADANALHVQMADLAVPIGPSPARDSYLRIDTLLEACRASGAQAVHPGYGFLSESADFSRACREAGIVFVGPPPEAIEALGNKSAAKQLAQRIGVPCLPGYAGEDQRHETLLEQAGRIGAPLMIKAAAGGGGRGMRRCDDVQNKVALRALLDAASAEAISSFGNGQLLLERLLERARHVEVQIFGDTHGNYIHLGERDCSTQRRNQKILEEAPAPGVDAKLRDALGDSAIRLAREVGYVGAGTVEFLLAEDGSFHFLEMNTRLQVEHPVTEAITGLDLVALQLSIAQGETMDLVQQDITLSGHAIEARLCAEDPWTGFAPQSGPIAAWQLPQIEGVRIDHGLAPQATVPPHYDSMLAKVIAHGADREQARSRLVSALRELSLLGIRNNRDYLITCLQADAFREARLATAWLGEAAHQWQAPVPDTRWLGLAAALTVWQTSRGHGVLAGFSSNGARSMPMLLLVQDIHHQLTLRMLSARSIEVSGQTDGETWTHRIEQEIVQSTAVHEAKTTLDRSVRLDGLRINVRCTLSGGRGRSEPCGSLDAFGIAADFIDQTHAPRSRESTGGSGRVTSTMHGQVVDVAVTPGQAVSRGQRLLSIEAMKMEHQIVAPIDGTVVELLTTSGQQVAPGRLLVTIEAAASA
jgi:geranyl-CoA carboxylase alpha subunit